MKSLLVISAVLALTACQPDYTIESCQAASSMDIVCIESRHNAEQQRNIDMSVKDFVDYSNAMFYFYENDISEEALTQLYVDLMEMKANEH